MKKKLFLLITCFVLFSSVTAFFVYRKRQLAEIARKEEERKRQEEERKRLEEERKRQEEEEERKLKEEEQKEKNNVDRKKNKIDNSYFFEKTSGIVTSVFILLLWSRYVFSHFEKKRMHIKRNIIKMDIIPMLKYNVYGEFIFFILCALNLFFSKVNSYGLSSLIIAIIVALLGQNVIDLIVGYISYFSIKDKNKKSLLRIFKILRKKKPIIFYSWSILFGYLFYGFIIAIIVRIIYIKKILRRN